MIPYLKAVFLIIAGCPSGTPLKETHQPPTPPGTVSDKPRDKTVVLTPTTDVPALRCTPCRLQIHADEPCRDIRADLGQTQKRIVVQAESAALSQELPIDDPFDLPESWELGTDDINFDGYADLYMVTSRGSVNEYAHYFRYVPQKHTFADVGTYPVFRLDQSKRTLMTHVKNGNAGLDYETSEYTIVDSKPELVRQERQSATDDPSFFTNTVSERVRGELKVVAVRQVQAPAPD